MTPRLKRLALLIPLSAVFACSRPIVAIKPGVDFTKINRVAILGFDDYPREPNSGEVVGSVFEQHLVSTGWSVVERRRVKELLAEQRLSATGAIDPKTAQKIGGILGVDALVMGAVTTFQKP